MRQLKINPSITKRNSEAFNDYLVDIAKYELISTDEEVELTMRIKKGDTQAMNRLVCANLRFVVSVAKQYQNQGLPIEDLVCEGNIGLIKAAEKFDETRGFKFISYAVWWIRQSILQALAEQAKIIRLPLNRTSELSKISKMTERFRQIHERNPSEEEIAEETGIALEKVVDIIRISTKTSSIDAPFSDNEESSLIDVISDTDTPDADNLLMNESLSNDVGRVLSMLTEREQKIIKMFFGIGCPEKTLDEIGDALGLTRERVRQIKEKAIKRLRSSSRNGILKSYLGK